MKRRPLDAQTREHRDTEKRQRGRVGAHGRKFPGRGPFMVDSIHGVVCCFQSGLSCIHPCGMLTRSQAHACFSSGKRDETSHGSG